ncbi:MAG: DUF2442 domain-containing protein [Chloroflexi bacterium]|nr:DUF2442 domain-containing protein [Chloroflexota bacterium]
MKYPTIKDVIVRSDHELVVVFSDNTTKVYDISPLLSNPIFEPLRRWAFFKNVRIEPGGYAISWNSEIDISEYELWKNGRHEA